MTKVTIKDANGTTHTLQGREGQTVMELARTANVVGIEAACGGERSCGTCAVKPAKSWEHILQVRGEEEADMLEFTVENPDECRLSCQIVVSPELDGLELSVVSS